MKRLSTCVKWLIRNKNKNKTNKLTPLLQQFLCKCQFGAPCVGTSKCIETFATCSKSKLTFACIFFTFLSHLICWTDAESSLVNDYNIIVKIIFCSLLFINKKPFFCTQFCIVNANAVLAALVCLGWSQQDPNIWVCLVDPRTWSDSKTLMSSWIQITKLKKYKPHNMVMQFVLFLKM